MSAAFISDEPSAEPPPESTLNITTRTIGLANASSSWRTTVSDPVERDPPISGMGKVTGGGDWLSPVVIEA